jgi:cyclophilin family peptidyl-prolyl cis-trans isomerase
MRARGLIAVVVLLAAPLAGCVGSDSGYEAAPCGELVQSFEPDTEHNPRLRMETTNGTMTIVVWGHQVPFSANHVRKLVEDETWQDTRFHLLRPGEAIYGGDPRSADDDQREAWGSGGYHLKTVDEHHQFLRHDEPGVVSFLSPQPNNVGSQFVITLSPQPSMDDRNPVFGQVIEGMDTARELSRTPTDDRGRPVVGARLDNVTWIDPPDPDPEPPELSAYGYDCEQTAEPGDQAEYLVAVRNTGQSILNGSLEADLPGEGWGLSVANADRVVVSSGQTAVYKVNLTVPEEAEIATDHEIELGISGADTEAATNLTLTTHVGELGPRASEQDQVQLHYVGTLDDGRVFETTETVYRENGSLTWFGSEPGEEPQPVVIDTETRSQLGELIDRARLGETVVDFQTGPGSGQTYGDSGLGGRLLAFQVHVTSAE